MKLIIQGGKEAEDKLRDNFTRVMCEIVLERLKEGKTFESENANLSKEKNKKVVGKEN